MTLDGYRNQSTTFSTSDITSFHSLAQASACSRPSARPGACSMLRPTFVIASLATCYIDASWLLLLKPTFCINCAGYTLAQVRAVFTFKDYVARRSSLACNLFRRLTKLPCLEVLDRGWRFSMFYTRALSTVHAASILMNELDILRVPQTYSSESEKEGVWRPC